MVKIKLKKLIPVDFTLKKHSFSALLAGVAVALILGILASCFAWGTTWLWWVLALGVLVGIANLFHEEGVLFMVTLLMLTFMLNLLAGITLFPIWAVILFQAVVYLLAPAAVIVGLKVLYALAVK